VLEVPGPALWVGDQLELAAPRHEKVHPALSGVRSDARRRSAEQGKASLPQEFDGGIEVFHVQRDVVATDVAVAGRLKSLIR
jgi:hypothetical protein